MRSSRYGVQLSVVLICVDPTVYESTFVNDDVDHTEEVLEMLVPTARLSNAALQSYRLTELGNIDNKQPVQVGLWMAMGALSTLTSKGLSAPIRQLFHWLPWHKGTVACSE